MPTPRGWLVAAVAVVLLILGTTFGAQALQQAGIALLVLVWIALAVVRLARHELHVTRRVAPVRAQADQPVEIRLRVDNPGRGAAPLMLMEDRLPRGLAARARFSVNGIEPGGHRELGYSVVPKRRGRYEIGPVAVASIDPFSLARVRTEIDERTSVVVRPAIEPLALPPDTGERRAAQTASLRNPTGARGEEFYTLREYEHGDDLRRVHWPSSAKRGKYMIRQEETPWQTRATIVIDDRRDAYPDASEPFERAIEAAASVLSLYSGSGYTYRLLGAHLPGTPSGRANVHLHRCLDLLATLGASGGNRGDDALLARLAAIASGGVPEETLVVVTGSPEPRLAAALGMCRRLYKHVALISFPAHRFGHASTKARWEAEQEVVDVSRALARAGARCIVLGPGDRLGPSWSATATRQRGGERWAPKPELV